MEDTGAYVRFGRHNPQAIFNIDKLLDTAREFDRRGYTTLQDFVEWVKNIRRTEQREATSDMNLPGFQGSVSIMTVHKAKGLEYPVMFLPGMNQSARSLTIGPEALIEETNGTRRMAIRGADNPVYEDLWKGEHGEQEELRREHQRLLYVAMTRARDHLIMLGTLGNNKTPIKQNTWLEYLSTAAPKPLFDAAIDLTSGVRLRSYPDTAKELSAPEGPPAPLKRTATGALNRARRKSWMRNASSTICPPFLRRNLRNGKEQLTLSSGKERALNYSRSRRDEDRVSPSRGERAPPMSRRIHEKGLLQPQRERCNIPTFWRSNNARASVP